MGKMLINGGGSGGVSSDDLDTLPGDVLAGKKFGGIGSDDPQFGTMLDRRKMHGSPAVNAENPNIPVHPATYVFRNQALNGVTYIDVAPPNGYYSGQGDGYAGVTESVLAPLIGATGNKIIPGQSICGVAGAVPSIGAQTINPSASQQSIASLGKYMTGNVIVNPVSLPNAQDLRQGVNWYGRVGTMVDYSYLALGQTSF